MLKCQGPKHVRQMELPNELKFRVDDKVLKAIDDAVILHKKGV